MPIHGELLGYQRRSLPIGEIRMGYSVAVPRKKGRQPMRSDTWRFTTGSEQAALVIAERYEGTMAPWERRKGRWEIITSRTALDVWVPPRGEAVDTSMVLYDGPRRKRECDGKLMSFPERRPCMCPLPADPADPLQVQQARAERERLAAMRPPQACKVLTRFALTIPDLPGLLGVWRLNTGSVQAAVETADAGDVMAIAREGGAYCPAVLRIEWRPRGDGSLCQVPVLMLGQSMRELADRALPAGPGGLLAQLQALHGEQQKAITSGAGTRPADPSGLRDAEGQAPEGDGAPRSRPQAAGEPGSERTAAHGPGRPELTEDERYKLAQAIADECAAEGITPDRFRQLWAVAKGRQLEDEFVYVTDDRQDGPCDPLGERLDALWREKGSQR